MLSALKTIKKILDKSLLLLSLTLLALMVLITIYQVYSRQILGTAPAWTEASSRILFVWVGFLGIAYGFQHKLHIGVGLFVSKLPERFKTALDYMAKVMVIAFGGIMIYYGVIFTNLMSQSNVAGLGIPSSVMYAAIPVAGFYVLMNGIELLFVKGMHQEYNIEEEEGVK